jgi:hypothetical protein
MQLRPPRQQLLPQHHAKTKNLPRSRSPSLYPSARSARTNQHYRRGRPKLNAEESNSRAKAERKKKPTALLLLDQRNNSNFLLQNQKDPKTASLPPLPKFIKITKIPVKYIEEIVR